MAVEIDVLKAMPKLELHAHLNGSLSSKTIKDLLEKKNSKMTAAFVASVYHLLDAKQISEFGECFSLFRVAHELVDDAASVEKATSDVVREFFDDGVRYLELRSTPKNGDSGMTKEDYVLAMIRAIEQASAELNGGIIVRLILSIDRKNPHEGLDTVRLAIKYKSQGVVGIDLSGDPRAYTAADFIPALTLARDNDLKLFLHLAEVPDTVNDDMALVALHPDRIGHGTYLDHLDPATYHTVPIEICPTSNVLCGTVTSYADHHVGQFIRSGAPHFIICTDDKGVFNCTLSGEYKHVADAFQLSIQDLWRISVNSIEYIAEDEEVKQRLRLLWEKLKPAGL